MKDFNPTPEFEEKVRRAMDVPNADPEFVATLRNELARRPVKMKSRSVFRPAWVLAFVLALAVIVMGVPPLVQAIGRLFGYVPEVGLVENTGDLRMLAEPVSQTRDGVTLTISYVLVDQTHVEVIYDAQGIPAENDSDQAADAMTNPRAFCGGVAVGDTYNKEGDPILKLPDGTSLERDLTTRYPQNVFAMKPVYEAQVPADVLELTFMLKCIPNARLGAVPENWELPIKLRVVSADTVLGSPVVEVGMTSEPVSTDEVAVSAFPAVTIKLERVVAIDEGYVFYLSMNLDNPDPLLVSIMPANIYVIDSTGKKIPLMTFDPMHPIDHPIGSSFEYQTWSKPADGQLTLVVEDAIAYFDPPWVNPVSGETKPEGTVFTFDAGADPQHNQTWALDSEFEIAGHSLRVTSVRAITFDDMPSDISPFGSQGFEYGYQFTAQADSSRKVSVEMDIVNENYIHSCYPMNVSSFAPERSSVQYSILCRDGFPKGPLTVAIRELSVLGEGEWKVAWSPDSTPVENAPALPAPKVTMTLEKIVPMDSATVFYISMDMENKDPSLVSIMPVDVYVVDSLGQKIRLIGNYILQPFEHRPGSLFEFTSQSKPASGPLTVMVENAVVYYAPLYVDPPQATPEEMSFTFDAGADPQHGQTWDLNSEFKIAGYPLKVTSARATTFEDLLTPEFLEALNGMGSQGFDFGYEFTVHTDPAVKLNVEMDIMLEPPMCYTVNSPPFVPSSSSVQYTQLCRESYPSGLVKVTIRELSVLLENTWQSTWAP